MSAGIWSEEELAAGLAALEAFEAAEGHADTDISSLSYESMDSVPMSLSPEIPVNIREVQGQNDLGTNVPVPNVPSVPANVPAYDPAFLDRILNAPDLDDAQKAFFIAVERFGMTPAEKVAYIQRTLAETPSAQADMIIAAYRQEKARNEAKRLVASEDYRGSDELSWDQMEDNSTSYIVDDLIPDNAVVFFFAKRNLGKTYAYLDMVLRCQFGMDWLGKPTRAVKTLIVLGEGQNGFVDRIRAWCDRHGKDYESLRECISFVSGANLNNDESLARIRAVADREEVELVIFDTYAAVSGSASEDDAALNSTTMNRAASIRPGSTLFFVHHPRKAEEDSEHPVMRGSGSLEGRADVVLSMFRDRKFAPRSGEKYEWLAISTDGDHGGKNRTAALETIRGLYLDEEGDSAVFSQIDSESVSRAGRTVADKLTTPMTARDFAPLINKSEKTARRQLEQAVAEGIAIATPSSTGAKIYSPTAPPNPNYSYLLDESRNSSIKPTSQ
jgi:hypothetical protein